MGTVRAVFCRNHLPMTALIRLGTWSSWAHVAPIMGDERDSVIDATWAHGVSRRSLQALLDSSSRFEVCEVEVPDPRAAYDWARSQLGRPYDKLGVCGLALRRNWMDDDSWFCSEFWEAMLAAGGRARFRADAWRVTPQHSWMVR